MDLLELFKESKIYNKNHPKFLEHFFLCPKGFDIKSFNSDEYYFFEYLPKSSLAKTKEKEIFENMSSKEKKEYREKKYLECSKKEKSLLNVRPVDFDPSKYRIITNFKKEADFIWVKKAQRKMHEIICSSLKATDFPYVQSTIKGVSYASNSKEHIGNKNILMIDLKDFFTEIDKNKVQKTMMRFFALHSDIAELYAKILTSPYDVPPFHNGNYVLGQGLPSSPIIAFLCNIELFEYLNVFCINNNIKMTIYVDDVTFSSDKQMPQHIIDKIIGTFFANGLKVNRRKVHLSNFNRKAKITGCYVSNSGVKIKSSKHEEIKVLYEEIIKRISLVDTLDDYFYLMNLFLKFHGNYNHLQQVEFKITAKKTIIPIQFKKYDRMKEILKKYFLFGMRKKNKGKIYSKDNILKNDEVKYNSLFQKMRSNKDEILKKLTT